jgi:hypothetical protein
MKVLLFGASGMVGSGVLRECLLSPDVDRRVSPSRPERLAVTFSGNSPQMGYSLLKPNRICLGKKPNGLS